MKIVREYLQEGYGSGFSFTGGAIRGMGSGTRGGFGGANNLGGPNMMYTYEIKPLNHTLEQKPTVDANSQVETIQLGSKIQGEAVRSNAMPNKQKITGIVQQIAKTDDSALKYYLVRNEETQELVKIDPLTASLIIHDPVEYYFDNTDTMPSKRKEKLKRFRRTGIVRESITE